MATIAVCFNNERNRGLLTEWINDQTEHRGLAVTDEDELSESNFDLCLLDGYCFEAYRDRLEKLKGEAEPRFLPYLLLIERRRANQLDSDVWDRVDDIIWQSASSRSSTETKQFRFELRGRWKSLLDARQLSTQLDRERNLVEVLNRVLRHNLRNDISVVRGMVNMLADASAEAESHADTALETIDELIDLAEKVREFDSVTGIHQERHEIDLVQVIDRISEDVKTEYPAASISFDSSDEQLVYTKPSIENALREVVENAAIHAGDQPTIDIGSEVSDERVQIQVTDDGPGLPTQEQAMLQTGTETPLSHGSGMGLWMVHWIVTEIGGRINTDVSENGTTVEISLPFSSTETSEELPATDEIEIARTQDRFKAIFENANDAILLADDERRFVNANKAASELFGVSRRDLLGRRIEEFAPNDANTEEDWKEFETDGIDSGEFRIQRQDGTERIVEYRAVRDIVPGQHLSILRDITERKKREQELERMRDFFEEAQRLGDLGAWEVGKEGKLRWTEGTRRIYEVDQDFDPTVADAIDFYRQGDKQRIEEALNKARGGGEPYDIDARITTAKGDVRWVRTRGKPTDDGAIVRGFIQDITDRKEREENLKETQQRLETIIELSPVPIWTVDTSGTVTQWNDAAQEAFGYSETEVIGEQLQSLVLFDEEQSSRFQERLERVLAGERIRGLEVERQRKDGTTVHLNISAAPLRDAADTVTGVIGVAQDITELKEREQETLDLNRRLRAEKDRYESLFTSIRDAILVADTDREIIDCNPAFENLFGYELDEIEGKHTKYVYASEEAYEEMGAAIEEHIGDPEFTHTVTYEKKSGETFPGETNVSYLRNDEGEIDGFIGVIRDISE